MNVVVLKTWTMRYKVNVMRVVTFDGPAISRIRDEVRPSRRGLIQFHGGIVMRCRAAGQPPVFRPFVWGTPKKKSYIYIYYIYSRIHVRKLALLRRPQQKGGGRCGTRWGFIRVTVRRFC